MTPSTNTLIKENNMTYEELFQSIITTLQQAISSSESLSEDDDDNPEGSFEGYLEDSGFDNINKED